MANSNIDRAKAYMEKRKSGGASASPSSSVGNTSNIDRARAYMARRNGNASTLASAPTTSPASSYGDFAMRMGGFRPVERKPLTGLSFDEVNKRKATATEDEMRELNQYGVKYGYNNLSDYDKELKSIDANSKYADQLRNARNLYALDNKFEEYRPLMGSKDFASLSKYDGQGNATYKWLNDQSVRDSLPSGTLMGTGVSADPYTLKAYDRLKDEEIATYNYIYKKDGEKKAQEFLDSMQRTLEKRRSDEGEAEATKRIEEGGVLTAIGDNLKGIITMPGVAVANAVNMAKGIKDGDYNPYSYEATLSNSIEDMRKATGNKIAEATEGAPTIMGQNAPRFLYDTLTSTVDSMYGAASFGRAFSPVMGMNAFQSTARDMANKGADDKHVALTAATAGIEEMLFEKVSLDQLLKAKSPSSIGKLIKEVVKQGFVEGSEEVATEASNLLTDYLINGGASDIYETYSGYVNSGYSEDEAKSLTARDSALRIGGAFIGGAISGGISGAAFNAGYYANNNNTGKTIRGNNRVEDLYSSASSVNDKESEAYKEYSRLAQKGNASNAELGNLYALTQNELVNEIKDGSREDATNAIKDLYLDWGYDEQRASESAEAMANKFMGLKDSDSKLRNAVQTFITDRGTLNTSVSKAVERSIRNGELNLGTLDSLNESRSKMDRLNAVNTYKLSDATEVKSKDGELTLVTDEGDVPVTSKNMSATELETIEIAQAMPKAKQKAFLANFEGKSASLYEDAFNMVYEAGRTSADIDSIPGINAISQVMSQKAIADVYKAGLSEVSNLAKESRAQTEAFIANHKGELKAGTFNSAVKYENLSSGKKVMYNFLEKLSAIGVNVNVIDDASSKSKNGEYNTDTNAITVNLSARYYADSDVDGIKYVMPTIAHELTHWMEYNAGDDGASYNKLKALVTEAIGSDNFDSLVAKYEAQGLSTKDATSEVMARSLEDVFNDSERFERLLNGADETTLNKIRSAIKEIYSKIKGLIDELLSGYSSRAEEAKLLKSMASNLDEIYGSYMDMLETALANAQKNSLTNKVGADIDDASGTVVNSIKFNLIDQYENLGFNSYEQAVDEVANEINEKANIGDINAVKRWILAEESIAGMIINEELLSSLDYVANDSEVAIKTNSDYKQGTVDFSNLCRKREIFTRMFDNLQMDNPNQLFTADDIAIIRQVLEEEKYEVACALCYVEDRRQKVGEIADTFIGYYKDALNSKSKKIFKVSSENVVKPLKATKAEIKAYNLTAKEGDGAVYFYATDNYIPTQADLVTEGGLTKLKKEHPSIALAFINYNNSRGMASARLVLPHAEYKREILSWTPAKVKRVNDAGGLRVFSFSDFEAQHLIDLVQIVTDCASKGVMIQTYTKVPEFAALIRNTGVKANRSLIPANVGSENAYARNKDGKFVKVTPIADGIAELDGERVLCFDTKEGIDVNSEYFLDEENNADIGNILIGISKDQIELAMNDEFVDYIIPFHTGQQMSVLRRKGIAEWRNYKNDQEDKPLPGNTYKRKKGVNIYTDVINKHNVQNAKEFTDWFLKECDKQKFEPRFSELLTKTEDGYVAPDGYYKLLLDYKLFDKNGNIVKQREIAPNFEEASESGLINKILLDGANRIKNLNFDDEIMAKVKARLASERGVVLNSEKVANDTYEIIGENKRLAKENKILKDDIERLREKLRIEKSITGGSVLNENQLDALATRLRKEYGSNASKEDLVNGLRKTYNYILEKGGEVEWDVLMDYASDVASEITYKEKGQKYEDDFYKKVKQDLQGTKIRLSDSQKAELKNTYGSRWQARFTGKFVISDEGMSLDKKWVEWSDKYESLFDADISEANQGVELLAIYDTARDSAEVIEYYLDSEAERAITQRVYEGFWEVDTVKSTADKYNDKLNKLKIDHKNAMAELKETNKQALDRQKLLDQMYYGRVINNLKTKTDTKIKELKESIKASKERQREQIKKKALIEKITANSKTLMDWINKPNAKKGRVIPVELQEPVMSLLNAIDFSSKRLLGMTGGMNAYAPTNNDVSLRESIEKINSLVQTSIDAQLRGEFSGLDIIPEQYRDELNKLLNKVNAIERRARLDNEYILQQMDSEDLEVLNNLVSTMKNSIKDINNMIASRFAHSVDYVAQKTMKDAKDYGTKVKVDGALKRFFDSDMITPVYFFNHLGEGGKLVYNELMDGFEKFSFNIKAVDDYANSTYKANEVREWEKQIHTITVVEPLTNMDRANGKEEGDTVTFRMTTPQIMSLYCLNKREQARSHIYQKGIRVDNFMDGMTEVSQPTARLLSSTDVENITSLLTDRQKEVADKLQEYMNSTGSDWGNEISLRRYGIAGFTEKNYFPISVDSNVLSTDPKRDKAQSIYALLNMSFTKDTLKNASNQIIVGNIFDVFTNHMSDMAKYNAMALPVLDTIKWFNYKEIDKTDGTQTKEDTLKSALEGAYGKQAIKYINDFLSDINGATDNATRGVDVLSKLQRNYKTAAVGYNLQVALLQPISYIRASNKIGIKYLASALTSLPRVGKYSALAKEKSGLALWKSYGFYDMNISKGLEHMIKHDLTITDKLVENSMALAGKGDELTMGLIFRACELEALDNGHKPSDEDFFTVVSDRFRDICVSTQVIDSVMTRSSIMRSTNPISKIATAFMGEPTIAYNTVMGAYQEYVDIRNRTGNKAEARSKAGKKIAVAVNAYMISASVESLVRTLFAEVRRPREDDEEFYERLLEQLLDQINPLNGIPVIKDIVQVFTQNYSSPRMEYEVFNNLKLAVKEWMKVLDGKGSTYKATYRSIQTASQFSGVPASAPFKDVVAIWNKTIGEAYNMKWD